jgi:HSP20 family molecular chaperone IbpA
MYTKQSIFDGFDGLFEFTNHNSASHSKTDIRKTDDGFSLDILLPGFWKEEVQVRTKGNDLIIEAHAERAFPKFLNKKVCKTFQVEGLDPESVSAKLEAGILSLEFSNINQKNSKSIKVL